MKNKYIDRKLKVLAGCAYPWGCSSFRSVVRFDLSAAFNTSGVYRGGLYGSHSWREWLIKMATLGYEWLIKMAGLG